MNINSKQVCFLHIPKTGGSYTKHGNKTKQSPVRPITYLGHKFILDSSNDFDVYDDPIYYKNIGKRAAKAHKGILRETINDKFVFSNIRNIFKWLVSWGGHVGCWKASHNVGNRHSDYPIAQKGFEYYIKTIANREFPYPSRKFIFAQLFSTQGDLIVDWINYTDYLDQDLAALAKFKNLKYVKQNKKRVSGNKDYRQYYTTDLIDLVYQTWKREIKLFNFNFDNTGKRNKDVTRLIKDSKIKYIWTTNYFSNS